MLRPFLTDINLFDSMNIDVYRQIKGILNDATGTSTALTDHDKALETYICIKDAYIKGCYPEVQSLGTYFFNESGIAKTTLQELDTDKQALLTYRRAMSEMRTIPALNIQLAKPGQRVRLKNLLSVFRSSGGVFTNAYNSPLMWPSRQSNVVEYLSRCLYYEENYNDTVVLLDLLIGRDLLPDRTVAITPLGTTYLYTFFQDNEILLKKANMQVRLIGALFNILQEKTREVTQALRRSASASSLTAGNASSSTSSSTAINETSKQIANRITNLGREYFGNYLLCDNINKIIPNLTNQANVIYAYAFCSELIGDHDNAIMAIDILMKRSDLFDLLDAPSKAYVNSLYNAEQEINPDRRRELANRSFSDYSMTSLPFSMFETSMPSASRTAPPAVPYHAALTRTSAAVIPHPNVGRESLPPSSMEVSRMVREHVSMPGRTPPRATRANPIESRLPDISERLETFTEPNADATDDRQRAHLPPNHSQH